MEVGHQVHQGGVDLPNPAAQSPGQLARRVAGPLPALGVQQVGHRLRLGQVQPPVEKGPLGELPGPGLAGPLGKQGLQPQGEHHGGAVTVELRRVLPGVALGPPAVGAQHPVNDLPLPVQQVPVHQGAHRAVQQPLFPQGAEHRRSDVRRPGAGQP